MKAEAFLAAMIGVLLCGAAGWAVGRFDGRKRWYLAHVIAGLAVVAVAVWGVCGGFHMSAKAERLAALAVIALSGIAFAGWIVGRLMHRRP